MLHNKQWTFAAVKNERKWMPPSFTHKRLLIYRAPTPLCFFSDLTGLDSKVPHFWDRRSQCTWNYLWSGDRAEMNIRPDQNETGNPGIQSIFLKQFNKKIVKFLEKLEQPKAYRVTCLSHKETQLSKKIFNTNFIQRKCEKILPYAKSNYASQIRPARLFLTQLQFTNILFSLFFF